MPTLDTILAIILYFGAGGGGGWGRGRVGGREWGALVVGT